MNASPRPEVFALRVGDLGGRLNADYYRSEFRKVEAELELAFPDAPRLDSMAEVTCGPFGSAITTSDYRETGVPLLRISNITKQGTLDLDSVVFISPELSSDLPNTQVRPGDLVVSQRGTLGMTALVSGEFPVYNISANLVSIRRMAGLDPRFLQSYLASRLGETQLRRRQSGQAHPKITTDDVASLRVPRLPNQQELATDMDCARARREEQLARARVLLSDTGVALRRVLGLAAPEVHAGRSFGTRAASLIGGGRMGPEFFHPERTEMIKALRRPSESFEAQRLGDVVEVVREQVAASSDRFLGLASVEADTGQLSGVAEDAAGPRFVFRAGDVLFARLRPYLNKVYVAEFGGTCSTEFHVLRVRPGVSLLPDFLGATLRSVTTLGQTLHMATGNTHPRLANDDVPELVLPLPLIEAQGEVVALLRECEDEARDLLLAARADWEDARSEFERRVLATAS